MEVWELKLSFYPSAGGFGNKSFKKLSPSLRKGADKIVRGSVLPGVLFSNCLAEAPRPSSTSRRESGAEWGAS